MWSKDVAKTTVIIIKILKYERILFISFVFFVDSSTSSVSGTNKVLIDKLLRDSGRHKEFICGIWYGSLLNAATILPLCI